MKRFVRILGILLVSILLILFFSTSLVDRTPYYLTDYYKKTAARVDSLKSVVVSESDSIQAGFSRISITPGLNNTSINLSEGKFMEVPLAGYGARKGKAATGIHDSIFVKAAALKSHNQTVVIVGADLLIMPPNIIDEVSRILSSKGIQRNQVFYSATHSHSSLGGWGPGFIGEQFAGVENKNISKWLVQQISKAVITAIEDLHPARIGSGCFNASTYTRNRLIGESGTKNDDFGYIFIQQTGGKKAIIGSFGAHSTTLGSGNMEVSADYPGYWERKMENTSADLAIFCGGSVGSQSPAVEGKGFDRPKLIGEALADSLNSNLNQVVMEDKVSFAAASLKVQLPPYHVRLTTKINLTTYLSEKLMPLPANVYLQALRIGKMVWITTPSDFSGEYALQIKNSLAAKGFNANVSSFNGSYIGYIIPGRYFYLDEYEPKIMGWFGPNMGEYAMDLIGRITGVVIK
jgi:hypothetical protein